MEGSVIVERQDANASAYNSDVTVKQLLSGSVNPPEWASSLIRTLENCTGMPGNRKWVNDHNDSITNNYAFGTGVASSRNEHGSSSKIGGKKSATIPFPPPSWGRKKDHGSYFDPDIQDNSEYSTTDAKMRETSREADVLSATKFATHFESDFSPDEAYARQNPSFGFPSSAPVDGPFTSEAPSKSYNFTQSDLPTKFTTHSRSMSTQTHFSNSSSTNPFSTSSPISHQRSFSLAQPPYITPKPELTTPLSPHEGVARAIALYNFRAVEVRIDFLGLLNGIIVKIRVSSLAICHLRKAMLSPSPRKATVVTTGMSPPVPLESRLI